MRKLTPKQENFCNYYLECGNATEAFRRAYSCVNMKPASITRKAFEILEKVNITARIKELQAEIKKKTDITKERILEELSSIAFSSFADIHETLVGRGEFDKLPAKDKAAIKSIRTRMTKRDAGQESVEYVNIELHDKIKAIERICKMLGFDTPTEVNIRKETDMDREEVIKELARLENLNTKE